MVEAGVGVEQRLACLDGGRGDQAVEIGVPSRALQRQYVSKPEGLDGADATRRIECSSSTSLMSSPDRSMAVASVPPVENFSPRLRTCSTVEVMPSAFRLHSAVVVAAAAGLLLSGCTGGNTASTPTPRATPSATPLYPSEEAALAAVTEAYGRYVEVLSQVASEGWSDLSPLDAVEAGDALDADQAAGERNRSEGLRAIGASTFTVARVQSIASKEVTAYVCLDVSATRIVDGTGADRTSPNRLTNIPFVSRFRSIEGTLTLTRSDPWSGRSFCK